LIESYILKSTNYDVLSQFIVSLISDTPSTFSEPILDAFKHKKFNKKSAPTDPQDVKLLLDALVPLISGSKKEDSEAAIKISVDILRKLVASESLSNKELAREFISGFTNEKISKNKSHYLFNRFSEKIPDLMLSPNLLENMIATAPEKASNLIKHASTLEQLQSTCETIAKKFENLPVLALRHILLIRQCFDTLRQKSNFANAQEVLRTKTLAPVLEKSFTQLQKKALKVAKKLHAQLIKDPSEVGKKKPKKEFKAEKLKQQDTEKPAKVGQNPSTKASKKRPVEGFSNEQQPVAKKQKRAEKLKLKAMKKQAIKEKKVMKHKQKAQAAPALKKAKKNKK